MKSEAHDVSQTSAALVQVMKLPSVDEESKKKIQAYLARDPEDADAENLAVGAPQANAFEFQSAGIIDLFKKLQDKFEAKLADTQKDEMNDKHESQLYLADLEDQQNTATRSREQKSEAKSKAMMDEADP